MTLDLVQRNAEVSIPFVLSSRGYGLLWNNPAVGHVELAFNRTRWVANAARQIDYWITAGTPASILSRYADVTGHVPLLPEWATGFWQSKCRQALFTSGSGVSRFMPRARTFRQVWAQASRCSA